MRIFASIVTFFAIATIQSGCGDTKATTAKTSVTAIMTGKTDDDSKKAIKETATNYPDLAAFETAVSDIVKAALDTEATFVKYVPEMKHDEYKKKSDEEKAPIVKKVVKAVHDQIKKHEAPATPAVNGAPAAKVGDKDKHPKKEKKDKE